MTHWQVGDVALVGLPVKIGTKGDWFRPVIVTYINGNSVFVVWENNKDDPCTLHCNISALTCDPELTLRQASDWRAAGGRVGP